ncbi:phosphate/phosphite/phosphonate ABC transporter substrate-binding protein [Natrialbaceae archaeon A-arb3/5]
MTTLAGGAAIGAGCLDGGSSTNTANGANTVAGWSNGTIEFGLPPFQDQEELDRQYEGLLAWLDDGFDDVAVEGTLTTSYSSVIESVVNGHTELANLSPLIYVMAADEGVTPLAVNELHGEPSYNAYVSTKADSDIETLADLEGKTVAMVDPLSTSGGLFPMHMLTEAGLDVGDVETDASDLDIEWSFGHDIAVGALADGHVDAAAYADFEHPADDEEIVVVEESAPIPLAAAVTMPETPDDVVSELRDRLLETPESALDEHIVSGFAEYDPDDYDLVREVAETFGVSVSDLDEAEG